MSAITKTISEFIEFCRNAADKTVRLEDYGYKKPFWLAGLNKFHGMYAENPEGFIKVFTDFIDVHRQDLETPAFDHDGKANHDWIKIPKTVDDEDDSWAKKSKKPRGVVIWMSPDPTKLTGFFLPLTEVYTVCLALRRRHVNLGNVPYDDVPLTFLWRLFQCLDAVEPNNHYFEQNLTDLDEALGDSDFDTGAPAEAQSPGEVLEAGMGKQATGIMAMLQNFKPENIGDLIKQASANPMARFMMENMTKLKGEELDLFFAQAPVMMSAVQTKLMDPETIKTIMDQESVQMIIERDPEKKAVVQALLSSSVTVVQQAEETPVTVSAEDQE